MHNELVLCCVIFRKISTFSFESNISPYGGGTHFLSLYFGGRDKMISVSWRSAWFTRISSGQAPKGQRNLVLKKKKTKKMKISKVSKRTFVLHFYITFQKCKYFYIINWCKYHCDKLQIYIFSLSFISLVLIILCEMFVLYCIIKCIILLKIWRHRNDVLI